MAMEAFPLPAHDFAGQGAAGVFMDQARGAGATRDVDANDGEPGLGDMAAHEAGNTELV